MPEPGTDTGAFPMPGAEVQYPGRKNHHVNIRNYILKCLHLLGLSVLFAVLLAGCGGSTPLEKLKRDLDRYPEYSIILEDMMVDGNFFKEYYHKYKIIRGEAAGDSLVYYTEITDWVRVDKDYFNEYQRYLGMTLAAKTRDGEVIETPQPPAYHYVGNERYGQWRHDNSGNRFWEFYGQYAFLQALLGGFGRPIYYDDWDTYRRYRSRGEPYFGKNRQYGTYGESTKKTNPTFFQRRQAREAAQKSSFSEKLKQRTRRSNMSRSRSRSGGFGK